jgi:hypothetical protein
MVTWVDDSAGWHPVTADGFDHARAGEERHAIYVWRSERHGGDTKTEKSRRTLALPQRCVEALRTHMKRQERARKKVPAAPPGGLRERSCPPARQPWE